MLTVYGLNFDDGARVNGGGVAAPLRSISTYFLSVVIPPHAPGIVGVEVVSSDGSRNTLAGAFTYK
jgi:IPT/TIG domain-containing protein